MKKLYLIAILAFSVASLFSQTTTTTAQEPAKQQSQEVVVRIQQDAPRQQAPLPNTTVAQKANEWVEVGTNIGTAIGSGLKSVASETKDAVFGKGVTVIDGIDKVSKTDAGRFTMAVIAWKVAGNDAMVLLHRFIGVAVGVPLEIVVIGIYIWFIRRFTMTRQVKAKVTGGLFSKDRVVTYVTINAIDPSYNSDRKKMADEGVVSFITEDFKICALVVSTLALAAFSLAIIAGVIF